MLQDVSNRGHNAPAPSSHVRPLQPGEAGVWVDLGKLRVGQTKQHYLAVHNTTSVEQELTAVLPGKEFQVTDARGHAGSWRVPAGTAAALTLTFTPQSHDRTRAVVVFRFADGTEAGRLAVSAAVAVAANGATGLARPAVPRHLPPQEAGPPASQQPPPHQQHQGEKRARASAGLATPRGPPPAAAAALPAGGATPSMQRAKKAREMSRLGSAAGPAMAMADSAAVRKAPDPSTPKHAVMRHSNKPPGSVEETTPGAAGLVPRLPLGMLRDSSQTGPAALGSSRFAQELAATAQGTPSSRQPLASSSMGGGRSPAPGSARRAAAAGPKTFTHFHTSLWMDKQETAFKAWLNATLLPAAGDMPDAAGGQAALASRRLTAKMRGLLWRIYQRDEQFRDVMLRVEQRVMSGQLKMRDEEACLKNLKEQAKARDMLLSYHPFWLRLGMEVVVNRAAASGDKVVSLADLDLFMRDWFLRDPDLARQHAPNKAVNGLYPKAYWVQLGQLVLSRLLLLVALLDRAMAGGAGLPQGVPLLFNLRSKVKGSAQVLHGILPGWLSGEGDILRSLGRLGYKLQYEQQPKREVNFAVTNLAVDLRDGLRLCKLADALMGTDTLFEQARFPADKRPVKLHNVQLALGEFTRAGLSCAVMQTLKGTSSLQPVDVIDGDREKTLALLWRLILRFQLPQLVDAAAVRLEIERIKGLGASSSNGVAGTAAARSQPPISTAASFQQQEDHVALLLQWVQAVCEQYGAVAPNFTSAFADGHLFCLLIHFYLGPAYLPAKDIYVPSSDVAAQQAGSPSSTSSSCCSDEEDAGWRAMHGGCSDSDPAAAARHRQGVARNFELVHSVAEALGSIPAMVSASDILEHGPDEKAVVLFTAFLCQRLMEMSREERAAMVMQRLWRRRQLHRPGTARAHLHRWIKAATVIQRAARVWLLKRGLQQLAERRRRCIAAVARLQAIWRGRPARLQYLQLRHATLCIQAAYRGKMARRRVFQEVVVPRILARGLRQKRAIERSRYQGRLLAAVVSMQALRRGSVQRQEFLRMRRAAVAIQAAVRSHQASSRFQRQRAAAVVLQKYWRRRQAMQLLCRTKAAIVIQRHLRGHAARKALAVQHAAATTIQAQVRSMQASRRYTQLRGATLCFQAAWRGRQARLLLKQHKAAQAVQREWRGYAVRKEVQRQRAAAIVLQKHIRGHAVRRALAALHAAAVIIQAAWRSHSLRHRYQQQRSSAVRVQVAFRAWAARRQFCILRKAAIAIQRHWRGHAVRRHVAQQHQAATAIQAAWRCSSQRRQFLRLRTATVLLQSFARRKAAMQQLHGARQAAIAIQRHVRGALVRRALERQRAAAVCIQAAVRMHQSRQRFQQQQQAAVVLQARVRSMQASRRYQQLRSAAVCLQSAWRGQQARLLLKQHKAAQAMQAAYRAWVARRQFCKMREAAIAIQKYWRGHSVRRHLAQQHKAASAIQAAWRCSSQRRQFLRLRTATVLLQSFARRKAAMQQLHGARQAAITIQRHVRGALVRRALERQRAAAVCIQAAVRMHQSRQRLLRVRSAALAVQTAWRGYTARQQLRRLKAAVILQSAWRSRQARLLLKQHKAAQTVQCVWRGYATRMHLLQTQAAVTIQRHVRGFLARRQKERQLAAVVFIQRQYRLYLDRKRQKAIEAMTRQMRELAATMQLYAQRAAAALRIQAAWRGHLARVQYAKMLWEHRERLRLQAEREAAARAVIAPWLPVFRDRTWFLRARRAVRVLQRWWRKEYAQRTAAAVTLQAAARRFLAVRRLEKSKQAASAIQAAWRGHQLRAMHPKARRFAEMRKRLARANASAIGQAHRSLAARTAAGLQGLLSSAHLVSAAPHLEALAPCLEASRACCDAVVAAGGTAVLLRLVQAATREKSCQEPLRCGLLCLAHLCRYPRNAAAVFQQEGLLAQLGDHLQHHRDKEEVFLAAAQLLQRLVADPRRALALSRMAEVMAKYEGVDRMLVLRLSQEHKYLAKLEGQKGSDVSARQSTRALVSLARQHHQLQKVLAATGAPCAAPAIAAPGSPGEEIGIGKNTIVRRTLAELQNGR